MTKTDNLQHKLTRARTQLLLNQPFFGTLCLRLKLMSGPVPAMATDGRRIVYDRAFVNSLQPAELEAVLAHEVLHCALGHHCRRGQRDPRVWNEAADLAINPLLVRNRFSLPAGALIDPRFDNLSAEEIYARLMQSNDGSSSSPPAQSPQPQGAGGTATPQQESRSQQPPESGSGDQSVPQQDGSRETGSNGTRVPRPGGFGEVLDATEEDGKPASEAEKTRQQHEWNIAADQARTPAQSGIQLGDFARMLILDKWVGNADGRQAGVRMEGLEPGPEAEAIARRFIEGELSHSEYHAEMRRLALDIAE